MFDALINRAANSVESAVARYFLRALIAIPFVIALAFAVAAVTIKLSDRYGTVVAYGIVAAAFAAVGIVAFAAHAATDNGATNLSPAEPVTASTVSANPVADESPSYFSSDLLLAALGTVGPKAIPAVPSLFRFATRNWALILSIALVIFMLTLEKSKASEVAPEPAE